MPADAGTKIYSATYSNVPVYEFNVEGNHVMRRRADDWINATHILKVADFDKPARTRILEREVQKGVHEKVQGGYGKYQGTWVPLTDGRILAERQGVLEKLLPIFDFVPGDRSPPPAPKHATAASSRPKAPRQSAGRRMPGKAKPAAARLPLQAPSQISDDRFDEMSAPYNGDETPDNVTVASESMMDEQDVINSQYSVGGRKRKRDGDQLSLQDRQHQIWADALLDYFMLLESEDRFPHAPEPPPNVNLDRMIDEKGHSAMHWAAAMGDVDVVKDLLRRGARIDSLSNNLETPLMRAVMFTNNFDKNTMPTMIKILQPTVVRSDWFGSTVFHHIVGTTSSKSKYVCARYYLDCIINKLSETWIPEEVTRLLNQQDKNGDTAIMIAARNGARKCVRSLLGRNVAVDIHNHNGETADDLIRELNARRRDGRHRGASSSPFAPDGRIGLNGSSTSLLGSLRNGLSGPTPPQVQQYRSQTAQTLMSKIAPTIYEKCEQLAVAYEAELAEKEAEAADAERVVRKRQAEVEAVRKQLRELGLLDPLDGVPYPDERDEEAQIQQEELDALLRESQTLLELEQKAELRKLIADEKSGLYSNPHGHDANDGESSIKEQLRLALEVGYAQAERRQLVTQVVQHLSTAGMGKKSDEYKRLITVTLGVREEDVEAMVPDILSELEEAREREALEASPD
ncbi:apses-domain-containing protein [Saccharata proteae CBS 121410]|uniref:Apses-domain-containing protein n=1 Tax=Saccharata proteae CBS 121410 TaxID=1314787 RepID=A0A9P4HQM3_9PEZI|nr:apses-domain-containing protein [Saccharata proteae CBS 121410]